MLATSAACSADPTDAAPRGFDVTTTSLPTADLVPASAPTTPERGEVRIVAEVIDGDTIVVDGNEHVRLIGVDTPETKDPRTAVQCFGKEASTFTESMVAPGTDVRLVFDVEHTDRYGRTLAYVYRAEDDLFINAALVRDGYAVSATFPPNVAHAEEFVALASEARAAGRGLWAACTAEETASVTAPVATTTTTPQPAAFAAVDGGEPSCDPAYPTVCIPGAPPDLDCADVSHRRFEVRAPDPHGFDRDADGIGCESG